MASDSASLNHKESQASLISLARLDPSPIDMSEKELPPLPDEAMESSASTIHPLSRSSTASLGLSGGGRGPIFYLTRIQRYSSYTFTVFAGLHLANTSLIPLLYRSVPYSEPFLLMTRELYQTSLTEPLLVALPVLAHVGSGIALRLLRRAQNKRRYHGDDAHHHHHTSTSPHKNSGARIWPPVSRIALSGYLTTLLLTSHVAMNRILPYIVDGDSSNIGLAYVAHGFARHPVSAYIAYTLLLSVSAGHMVWGLARWLDLSPPGNWKWVTYDKTMRKRRRRAWWAIQGVAVALAATWAAGGLGVVARAGSTEGWLGRVYDGIYEFAGR
ncbi:hypothetical protein F4808DRAFT_464008 [Astrocystis sublimbata]|nr:hypothetical protein F4808DRAFT_464008 [Astrocystis sublimbata]